MDDRVDEIRGSGGGTSPSTSTSLLEGIRACDDEAWRRLLDLYVPLVFSWCRQSRMQDQDAADVVQDVFQAVLRGIPKFRYDRPTDTYRGWLRTIAGNKIRDHFSRRAAGPVAVGGTDAHERFGEIAADDQVESTSHDPWGPLFHRTLDVIRDEFEERTWQAFWLTTVQQHSSTDAARRLDMTPGAVRQAKYRVLRRLRQALGDVQ